METMNTPHGNMNTPRGGNGAFEDDLTSKRRRGLPRAMSRRKSSRLGLGLNANEDGQTPASTPRAGKKSLRQSSSLRKLFSRSSSDRGNELDDVGDSLLKPNKKYKALQLQVTKLYPGLSIAPLTADWAHNMAVFGPNSIKREVQDLNIMLLVMEENSKVLTHKAVERFFEWIPVFSDYLERYLFVEEDMFMKWVENKTGKINGKLKLSTRMKLRGTMRLKLLELIKVQDKFTTSLPAGERLHLITEGVKEFTEPVVEYFAPFAETISPIIKENFKKKDVLLQRMKWVKHVTSHVGAQEFLVLYTRWLSKQELLEWKTKVLLPSDFKFRAYRSWQKDMDYAHFSIAKEFQEDLDYENADDMAAQEQARLDFERAQIAQRARKFAVNQQGEPGSEQYEGGEVGDENNSSPVSAA